jgi:hypothetical protein
MALRENSDLDDDVSAQQAAGVWTAPERPRRPSPYRRSIT